MQVLCGSRYLQKLVGRIGCKERHIDEKKGTSSSTTWKQNKHATMGILCLKLCFSMYILNFSASCSVCCETTYLADKKSDRASRSQVDIVGRLARRRLCVEGRKTSH